MSRLSRERYLEIATQHRNEVIRHATMIWHKISMNDQKNLYFRKKNLYEYGQYKEKPLAFQKKICISPNFRRKNLYFAKF